MTEYPRLTWPRKPAEEAGFDREKLGLARRWMDEHADDRGYRLAIVRDGYLVLEVNQGVSADERFGIASAAKSIYSNVLGIAVEEGVIPSADARVVDVYPEMMDVPEGEGPKEGRYAFPKDVDVTFRQLISNTSGYMKPGEVPGTVFHYQTYGMNVLTHALAKAYNLYDVGDPEGSPGFQRLIEEKIARYIGTDWRYSMTNFDLHERARLNIFGYYCQVHSGPLDLARVGWLWCNWGRWMDLQVIPEAWMRASVRVNPDIREYAPREEWMYGYGFWTNEAGEMWSDLPTDVFTASGAGGHYVTVFPTERLVVVQNPGPYHRAREGAERANGEMLRLVLDALI
ncbi:MAG: serine hydrolase domain-containing protein [Anaerolineae bacterium]